MTKQNDSDTGFTLIGEMLGKQAADGAKAAVATGGFCSQLSDLAARNVFAEHWARPVLDRRSRSLFTLGILIGRGATTELRFHARAAINNGLSVEQLQELIYHATAYAGFPAATQALEAIRAELRSMGLIE